MTFKKSCKIINVVPISQCPTSLLDNGCYSTDDLRSPLLVFDASIKSRIYRFVPSSKEQKKPKKAHRGKAARYVTLLSGRATLPPAANISQ